MQLTKKEQAALKAFARKARITYEEATGAKECNADIYLYDVAEIPKGFNPTTKYNLILDGLTTLPADFHPNVGGNLHLNDVTQLPSNYTLKLKGSLSLRSLEELPEGTVLTSEQCLFLGSVQRISQGCVLHAKNDLFLNETEHIAENCSLRAGSCLSLHRLQRLPSHVDIHAKDRLSLNALTDLDKDAVLPDCRIRTERLPQGEYETASGKYLCANNKLQRILSHEGDTYVIKTRDGEDCCLTDGNGLYVQGATLLIVKTALDALQHPDSQNYVNGRGNGFNDYMSVSLSGNVSESDMLALARLHPRYKNLQSLEGLMHDDVINDELYTLLVGEDCYERLPETNKPLSSFLKTDKTDSEEKTYRLTYNYLSQNNPKRLFAALSRRGILQEGFSNVLGSFETATPYDSIAAQLEAAKIYIAYDFATSKYYYMQLLTENGSYALPTLEELLTYTEDYFSQKEIDDLKQRFGNDPVKVTEWEEDDYDSF